MKLLGLPNICDTFPKMLAALSNITQRYPENIAIYYEGKSITFVQLDNLSDKLATNIRSKLVTKNRAVCFYLSRGIDIIVTMIAILKANCYYIPLDKKYPTERLRFVVENVEPALILCDSLCEFVADQDIIFNLSQFSSDIVADFEEADQELAYICFTSGTTSVPKGVLIRRTGLLNLITSAINILGVKPGDRVLQYSSISFDASGWDIYAALLSGGTIYMITDDMMVSPQDCHTYIDYHAINLATLTPTFLAEMPTKRLSALRNLVVMGDMADSKNMEFWCKHAVVYNGYGPTECTIGTTMHKFQIGDNPANIGKPFDNYLVYLLNDDLIETNPGMIYVGGPGVAVGYLKLDELTRQKFIQTKYGLLYKTGDMASRDANDDIIFIGRIDNQVKINGVRIELEEIENLTMSLDVINRACVVRNDNLLILYYTSTTNTTNSFIRAHLAKYLHPAVVPAKYQMVDKFHLNPNGKIDKTKLSYVDEEIIGTTNEVTEIYRQILSCKFVTTNSNYFELGGDSLRAYKISAALEKINIVTSPADVLRYPIISDLIKMSTQKSPISHPIYQQNQHSMPLSHIQIDMWYFQSLYPTNPAYNTHVVMILENIDIEILKKSYGEIFKKHQALRTRILLVDNVPCQTFDREITHIEMTPFVDEAQIQNEIGKPFNLLGDDLIRIKIFNDHGKYIIVTVKHGIIIDAFSENILKKDLADFYEKISRQEKIESLPVSYSYNIFLSLASNKKYWKSQLKNSQELNLEKNSVKNEEKTFHIKKDLLNLHLIEKCAAQHNTTMYIILLTAINVVLSKYSQTNSISIGTQVAMRGKEEWKDIVGFMVSTLIMKNSISSDMNVTDMIKSVAHIFYDAIDNPIVSFSKLLKYSGIPIDFMFVMENVSDDSNLVIGSSIAKYLEYDNDSTGFPISWYVYPNKKTDSLRIKIAHSGAYDGRLIKYMLDSFEIVLGNLTDAQKIKDISYLPIDSMIRGPRIDYGERTIISLFLEKVIEFPSKPVLFYSSGDSDHINESLTYLQVDDKSNHIAMSLIQKYNVCTGDIVGVAINKSDDFVCLLLGILKIGACYVPMDPTYPVDRLNYMISDCVPKIVIVRNLDRELDCKQLVIFGDLIKDPVVTCKLILPSADNLAYTIYTSGSTGKPKACQITHRSVINNLLYFAAKIKINTSDKVWNVTSTSFDIMVLEVFLPLLTGAQLYVCPACVGSNPVQLVEWINRHQPTVLQATPTLFSLIGNHIDPNPQMRILVGGEPLTNNIANILLKITKKVFNTYGPSETTIWSTCARIKSEMTIGLPIANTSCVVLDKSRQPVPPMCRGELYIGGHGVCVGYLNRPEINAEKFVILDSTNERYYNTGDIVIYNGQSFNYIGRNDFQIKINGHRIEIGEIISVLEQFSIVKNVAIKPIIHKNNTYLVAYIIANQIINQACILDFAREKLPSYMVPNFVIQLPRFPETLNGKIDMAKLPSPFESSDKIKYINTDAIIKPTNDVEEKIYGICNDILGIDEISINESLFNVGLQSIMIFRFIAKIKEIFGIILTTAQFIKNSTVAMCARLIKHLCENLS